MLITVVGNCALPKVEEITDVVFPMTVPAAAAAVVLIGSDSLV